MVLFFAYCKEPEAVKLFFSDMINKAIKEGYKMNINAYAWIYRQHGNIFCIRYKLFPSWYIFNGFFYFMFKFAMKLRYKKKIEPIDNATGIITFLELE